LRIVLVVVLVLVIEKAEDEDDVSSSVVPQFDTALNNPRKNS
jgi:hypothetical protein